MGQGLRLGILGSKYAILNMLLNMLQGLYAVLSTLFFFLCNSIFFKFQWPACTHYGLSTCTPYGLSTCTPCGLSTCIHYGLSACIPFGLSTCSV